MNYLENLSEQKERRLPHHQNQRRFRRFAITFATATTIAYLATSTESAGAQEVKPPAKSFDLNKLLSLKESKEISIEEMLLQVQEKERLKKEKEEREKKLLEVKAQIEQRERIRVQAAAIKTAKMEAEEREKKARQEAQRQLFSSVAHEEYFLAQIIELEAAKSRTDRIYSGSVVLNRVRTTYEDFRNVHTISEVFYQGGQYHPETRAKITSCVPGEESLEVAHGLLSGEIQCLEEKILYQTSTKKPWMYGFTGDANLPDAGQYYGYPLDFEEKCR